MANKSMSDLETAIEEFWQKFLSAPDSTSLKLFCDNVDDERFPKSFLESFVNKLTAEPSWNINGDPEYAFPKTLMSAAFEEEKRKIEEHVQETVVLTQEQIQGNIKAFIKQSGDIKQANKKRKDEKTRKKLIAADAKKLEADITNMKNQLRGCYNENEEGAN